MRARQVGLILVMVAVLGVIGVATRLLVTESAEPVLTGLRPLTPDVVDRIVLTHREDRAVLTRKGDGWSVGPYPVVQDFLDELWEVSDRFEGAELISSNRDNHYLMGVAPETGTLVEFWRGDQLLEELYVGDRSLVEYGDGSVSPWKSSVRRCFLRRVDEDEVFGVFCPVSEVFSPKPTGWSEDLIVQTPATGVDSVAFWKPEEQFVIRTLDGAWVVVKGNEAMPADSRVLLLLARLQQLRAAGFPTEDEVSGLDFDNPDATVTILFRDEDGVELSILLLFLERGDGSYYVKDAKKSWVHILGARSAAEILKNAGDLVAQSPAGSAP